MAKGDFAYQARNDGSVAISWRGRTVTFLTGPSARRFLNRMMDKSLDPQMEMARVTGNFKRGNEG